MGNNERLKTLCDRLTSYLLCRSNPEEEDSAMPEADSDRYNNLANLLALSPSSSDSTVINDTDSDSNDEEPVVLKKPHPKHNWFAIPEVVNRQMGKSMFTKLCAKLLIHYNIYN